MKARRKELRSCLDNSSVRDTHNGARMEGTSSKNSMSGMFS
jgi:hypothetical protein